jgi:hypothetical protein
MNHLLLVEEDSGPRLSRWTEGGYHKGEHGRVSFGSTQSGGG